MQMSFYFIFQKKKIAIYFMIKKQYIKIQDTSRFEI